MNGLNGQLIVFRYHKKNISSTPNGDIITLLLKIEGTSIILQQFVLVLPQPTMSKAQKTSYEETAPSAMGRASAVARTANTLDETLIAKWTPNREEFMKVTSLQDGNIRGGYWVLNADGASATIAFCFKNKEGRIFGLTTAHLFSTAGRKHDGVGEAVFVFLLRNPTETFFPYVRSDTMLNQMDYEMLEIGEVVAVDKTTDSAIFEVTNDDVKGRVDVLKLLPRSGLGDRELVLPRPSLCPLLSEVGTKCALYGATTRGNLCILETPSLEASDEAAIASDVGFEKESSCNEPATKDGDCGAAYVDVTDGHPIAIHHAMIAYSWPGVQKPNEHVSFGVPLAKIMAKHPNYFGEDTYGSIEVPFNGGEQQHVSDSGIHQRRNGAHSTPSHQVKTFPVKIVKGNVEELLQERQTNPYANAKKLDRSNARKTVSGQIYHWGHVKIGHMRDLESK